MALYPVSSITVDLFGGPGGWAEAMRLLGLHEIGVEHDPAACETRRAAGHPVVRADVATVDPWPFLIDHGATDADGLIASPPCPLYSDAGGKQGRLGLDVMADAIAELADAETGDRPAVIDRARARLAARLRPVLEAAAPDDDQMTLDFGAAVATPIEAKADRMAAEAALVLEPLRWALALRPRWIALEQVPPVLPLWEAMADALARLGYTAAAGVLNAADYGVPQTRRRAILVARAGDDPVSLPAPTHAKEPTGHLLLPWVSMAEALGWVGANTDSPARTVCGDRSPRWAHPDRGGDRRGRVVVPEVDPCPCGPDAVAGQPSAAHLDGCRWHVDRWEARDMRGAGITERHGTRPGRALTDPAPTVRAGGGGHASPGWVLTERQQNGATRVADAPAMTITAAADNGNFRFVLNTGRDWKPGGTRDDAQQIPDDEPAPTFSSTNGRGWWLDRPATTVAGDSRLWPPGHKINGDDVARLGSEEAAARYGDRAGTHAIRLEVWHALVLQGFPADYPVQGNRTEQFTQVGNAVPPPLALAVIRAARGEP